jgi:hypothetical protein
MFSVSQSLKLTRDIGLVADFLVSRKEIQQYDDAQTLAIYW